MSPIIIGVSGGTSCGKSSVADEICRLVDYKSLRSSNDLLAMQAPVVRVKPLKIVKLSQDNSYKILSPEDIDKAFNSEYNFDHPESQDTELFKTWLSNIKLNNRTEIPVYDFSIHSHSKVAPNIVIDGCDVLIVEGLFLFYDVKLRDLFDYKIFVDVNDDERLSRRIRRDIKHRGRNIDSILNEWEKYAQPGFEQFIFPTKKFVDIIIPRGGQNKIAIEMIATHIIDMINTR